MDASSAAQQRAYESLPLPAPRRAEHDRFREYARELAQQAPPLTPEQRTRLTGLLHTLVPARANVTGGAA